MSSSRRPGVIRGPGYESKCWAEVTYATGRGVESAPTRYRIVSHAKEPPTQGPYNLFVDGNVISVKYVQGAWYIGH